ncbi:MAG: NADH-quinone oxidoreductase subunit N [Halobacteriaceae archaeon]
MATIQAHPLTPQILLGLTALLVLLFDSAWPHSRRDGVLAGISAIGTIAAGAVAAWFLAAGTGQPETGGLISEFGGDLVVDGTSLFFTVVFASVTTLVILASYDYVRDQKHAAAYYALVMLAATGMSLMASANSLTTAFVALELASLPSYALVAFLKSNRGSVEAGLKYFLIGALSSAVMAYGISLVYVSTGSLRFTAVAQALSAAEAVGVLGLGVLMVAGGLAFKTASVPFHFWAPEAYEGAPAPVSAFLSSASKAAGFVLAFRVFTVAFPLEAVTELGIDWALLFAVLAVVTMTLGNFAAATQEEVKRMLAYSSIGHAGYVLIGLAALDGGGDLVLGASMMHLLVYGFMNTGAFLFIALTEHWDVGRTFEDYNGLASEAPLACVAMTVFMFSLAGLPVGAGFLSKYVLFMGAVGAGYAWLALIAAVNSALSLFYYSRVVKAMWIEEADDDGFDIDSRPVGIYAALMVAAAVTVGLLVVFNPVAETAISAAGGLLG